MNLLNARKEVERIRLRDLSFGSEIATQTRQRSVTASRSHQMERAGGSIAPSTTRCLPIRCQTYGSSGVSCSFSRRPCRHPLLTASAAPAANRLTPMAPGPLPPNDGEARKSPRGAASARRNRTKHPSFDQHSRLCVAIERLSNWRRLLVGAPAVGPPKQGWAPADRPTLAPLSVEDEIIEKVAEICFAPEIWPDVLDERGRIGGALEPLCSYQKAVICIGSPPLSRAGARKSRREGWLWRRTIIGRLFASATPDS